MEIVDSLDLLSKPESKTAVQAAIPDGCSLQLYKLQLYNLIGVSTVSASTIVLAGRSQEPLRIVREATPFVTTVPKECLPQTSEWSQLLNEPVY
jgi:hypothetical protein